MKADFLQHLHALPLPPGGEYPHGTPFVQALAHGSLRVELFAPATSALGQDIQQPHAQDELYVVQRGHTAFWLDGQRLDVHTGDVLFVPAGTPHRFEHFTDDFVTWVVFYGPQGGEPA
ncbi:MAG: cupin domain-containing protein [Hydrogenophaga sp.]|nr:cupin domain-containing protein [Hydrogenophaga sp.]